MQQTNGSGSPFFSPAALPPIPPCYLPAISLSLSFELRHQTSPRTLQHRLDQSIVPYIRLCIKVLPNMARKFFVGGNFKMYVGARRPPYPAMP